MLKLQPGKLSTTELYLEMYCQAVGLKCQIVWIEWSWTAHQHKMELHLRPPSLIANTCWQQWSTRIEVMTCKILITMTFQGFSSTSSNVLQCFGELEFEYIYRKDRKWPSLTEGKSLQTLLCDHAFFLKLVKSQHCLIPFMHLTGYGSHGRVSYSPRLPQLTMHIPTSA